jgi:hypothetical protein
LAPAAEAAAARAAAAAAARLLDFMHQYEAWYMLSRLSVPVAWGNRYRVPHHALDAVHLPMWQLYPLAYLHCTSQTMGCHPPFRPYPCILSGSQTSEHINKPPNMLL